MTLDFLWRKVVCDPFEWNTKTYLLLIDYFSRCIEVVCLPNDSNADCVIVHLKLIFARHLIPKILISDNGPP